MLVVTEREQLPVAQAREGSVEAWKSLFRRYRLPLYVYVVELMRDEQTSLDIVQETFINAFQNIAALRDNEKLGAWLFGIAHQKCIQQWRRRDRDAQLRDELGQQPVVDVDGPVEILVREEQEAEFMRGMGKLPIPQRSALLLHFVEGFSLDEIARITNTPIGTIKSRLYYGKRALRELLEDASE